MTAPARVVYVTDPGHSGTRMPAEVLREFRLHVPRPEAGVDAKNPRGLSETQWVADLHGAVLRSAGVQTSDPRPIAWHLVDRASTEGNVLGQIRPWLDAQIAEHGDLVINDPRLPWFLELWQEAATATGAKASCVTVLRAPFEVVSRNTTDDQGRGPVERLAGWINLMLGTELATRTTPRAFVRYRGLIHDWDDPAVPTPLRTLADDTWAALEVLLEHDDAGARAEFDRLRALYPYVHRRAAASPALRIAKLVPAEVVPSAVRQSVMGMLRRSRDATR